MVNDELSDNELVQLVQEGQSEAYDVLVRRYQAKMRSFVARYVDNHDDIYDIVQDIFLEAYRNIASYSPRPSWVAWLRTMCRHHIVTYHRKTRIHRNAIDALVEEALAKKMSHLARGSDNSDVMIRALKECVNKLSQRHQHLVQLRYDTGSAVKEIAEKLGQTAAGISMHLYRIRLVLERCVERALMQRGQ